MPAPSVLNVTVWEDEGVVTFARIVSIEGSNVTQASLSSIACAVYDADANNTLVASPTVTVASAVFDTLQTSATDPRWSVDSTGYNFRHTLAASNFPEGGRRYLVKYVFTPVSGDNFHLVVRVATMNLPGQ